MELTLTDDQRRLASEGAQVLAKHGLLYYACEMRTGKTAISLTCCMHSLCRHVLFVTTKGAIGSIKDDYRKLGGVGALGFKLDVINYESLHKLPPCNYDMLIVDEAHNAAKYPIPALKQKALRKIAAKVRVGVILLSGTPSPETYCQLFHQLQISPRSPWSHYPNFYRWAMHYVDIKMVYATGGRPVKDYSHGKDKILHEMEHIKLTLTREEAGFEQADVQEVVHIVPMGDVVRKAIAELSAHCITDCMGEEVVCESLSALRSKVHQLASGTCITTQGIHHVGRIVDGSKAQYLLREFKGKKLAIFYVYAAERDLLSLVYADQLHKTPEEFNAATSGVYLCQIKSGSQGVNLSTADCLIMYNINFSFVQYWQARSRLSHYDRTEPAVVHWLFSDVGPEADIYKKVKEKKKYTLTHYREWHDGLAV